jgi:hypothetical protein
MTSLANDNFPKPFLSAVKNMAMFPLNLFKHARMRIDGLKQGRWKNTN